MNDIIKIIEDLNEIKDELIFWNVGNPESAADMILDTVQNKIEKYQKILDEFENANKEEFPNREIDRFGPEEDYLEEESPDLTWAGTSGYSV